MHEEAVRLALASLRDRGILKDETENNGARDRGYREAARQLGVKSDQTVRAWIKKLDDGEPIQLRGTRRPLARYLRANGQGAAAATLDPAGQVVRERPPGYGGAGHDVTPAPRAEGSPAEQWMWEHRAGPDAFRRSHGLASWEDLFQQAYATARRSGWPPAEFAKLAWFEQNWPPKDHAPG